MGPPGPPARLHGIWWGGNLLVDEGGAPCLIDPAVQAATASWTWDDASVRRLRPRVFAAYDEAYALAPGHQERVPLYQLYSFLVDVNLFGTSYVGSVERALAAVV